MCKVRQNIFVTSKAHPDSEKLRDCCFRKLKFNVFYETTKRMLILSEALENNIDSMCAWGETT